MQVFLFGYAAAFGQYHWLVFDRVEGLWALVILGLFLASAVVACFYLVAGVLFRLVEKRVGHAAPFVFPALWVLIDYSRSLGELSFPWAFLGYSFTPVLPFSQLASITGVWGLTFIALLGNMVVWVTLKRGHRGLPLRSCARLPVLFGFLLLLVSAAGGYRMAGYSGLKTPQKKIVLLQSNIDQFRWSNAMLDTAFAVSESLVLVSSADRPDLMILPESALLCFLDRRREYRERVLSWVGKTRVPLVFGSLDWKDAPQGASSEYFVYNTAFFADTGRSDLFRYYKSRLVPFSEAIPFQGVFPILSRVNLGEADFSKGTDPTIFLTGSGISMAPLICYESIYPGYVRSRVLRGANLMVNITNDGWFGRSSGPRHHAMMARMRSIENGVSLARCANSGISMFVDPLGRVLGETGLYERTVFAADLPIYTIPTLYQRFGDWFVGACFLVVLAGAAFALAPRRS
ncbi:MAG: apolipoprotein N-acyltransferase [Chitinispirillaceae bacterium]|nr:apolipoprotein N-acyltransferase [Chitinispirillaceae bacterium]